jgi:hypothetical protein
MSTLVSKRRDRRDRHEFGVADWFAQFLSEQGVSLANCRNGGEAAGEPDIVCDLGNERRGIEVVDCWYSAGDAKLVWDLVADLEERGVRRTVMNTSAPDDPQDHPSGDPLIAVCQRQLDDHGVRSYGIKTWLLLNASQAPLHTASAGPTFVRWLKKPTPWHYLDAYVCLPRDGTAWPFFKVP